MTNDFVVLCVHCDRVLNPEQAGASTLDGGGKRVFFCDDFCKEDFEEEFFGDSV